MHSSEENQTFAFRLSTQTASDIEPRRQSQNRQDCLWYETARTVA